MVIRRVMAFLLAATVAWGATPVMAQVISGKATDEADEPYSDYVVQLRNPGNGQVVTTTPLTAEGRFSFDGLQMQQPFLVELYNQTENRVVCTEGPFVLTAPQQASRTDVNIDCGRPPAALWLLAGAAGAAAAIAVATQSGSQ